MKDYSKYLGCRFFKNEDGNLEVLKLISFVNNTEGRVLDLNNKCSRKIKYETLLDEYNLLSPDGYITFIIAVMKDDIRDIIVTLNRNKEIYDTRDDGTPYCVARQYIINIYNEVLKGDDRNTQAGMCMSLDTIPAGVDYRAMLACNEAEHFISIAYYLDDKLDDILGCFTKKARAKYDNVLEDLFQRNCELLSPAIKSMEKVQEMDCYGGFCRNLKVFMEYHDVMYDFRRGYNIGTVNNLYIDPDSFDDEVAHKLSSLDKLTIEKSYGFKMSNPIIMKYSKDMDITAVKRSHILFVDNRENAYLVIYDSTDDVIEAKHEMETFSSASDKLNMMLNQTLN